MSWSPGTKYIACSMACPTTGCGDRRDTSRCLGSRPDRRPGAPTRQATAGGSGSGTSASESCAQVRQCSNGSDGIRYAPLLVIHLYLGRSWTHPAANSHTALDECDLTVCGGRSWCRRRTVVPRESSSTCAWVVSWGMRASPRARWPGSSRGDCQVPSSVMVMRTWSLATVACSQREPGAARPVKACSTALMTASYTARVRSSAVSSSTTALAQRRKIRRNAVAFRAVAQTIKANGGGAGDGGTPGGPNGDQPEQSMSGSIRDLKGLSIRVVACLPSEGRLASLPSLMAAVDPSVHPANETYSECQSLPCSSSVPHTPPP